MDARTLLKTYSRRSILKTGALLSATAATSQMWSKKARAQGADKKFLFVVGAAGGGSIIDSFLPVLSNGTPAHEALNTYTADKVTQPSNSNFRCVRAFPDTALGLNPNSYNHAFMSNHAAHSSVMTLEGTSVNHIVAQGRSMNGAGVNNGRTLLEAVAAQHGSDMLLPAVNMAYGGYATPGTDKTLPAFAREEIVGDALYFPVATDPIKGMLPTERDPDRLRPLLNRARRVREDLDNQSAFGRTFRQAPLVENYLHARRDRVAAMREEGLLEKLFLMRNGGGTNLDDYGLDENNEINTILQALPDVADDPFHAQAALAYLLVRHGLSCAVALSPSFGFLEGTTTAIKNAPLGFDYSHTNHRAAQQTMWRRILTVTHGLVTLLQNTPLDDANPSGPTLFDNSLIYVATEFGRSKTRPANANEFSTGHHLNNGNLFVSPLLQGNRVFGGVDADTCLTYGFDPLTGDEAPTTVMREGDMYSAVCQALDVPFAGRRNMSAMMR